jgi:decaprenylphospho-beta-D-erythro-pentofuranosid-2-ulose 2-reductase
MSETVVILGANSGMARARSRRLAARGCRLILAGRRREEVDALAEDLRVRHGRPVDAETFDALDFDAIPAFVDRCMSRDGAAPDGVVLCYGYMTDQDVAQSDAAEARRTIDVNLTSAVLVLDRFAERFERRKGGFIAAISSVAGDRGRQSNYTYGAAKAGLTAYLQGLRNRLYRSGVKVLTIKPGFVDTPMSQGRVNPGSPLMATPDRVARDIDNAIRRRRDVLYTPWFWRPILAVIKAIPEGLFKRLKL